MSDKDNSLHLDLASIAWDNVNSILFTTMPLIRTFLRNSNNLATMASLFIDIKPECVTKNLFQRSKLLIYAFTVVSIDLVVAYCVKDEDV